MFEISKDLVKNDIVHHLGGGSQPLARAAQAVALGERGDHVGGHVGVGVVEKQNRPFLCGFLILVSKRLRNLPSWERYSFAGAFRKTGLR